MQVLSPVVQVPAGLVPHVRQDLAPGDAVAAQAVGDDLSRLVSESGQQALEKPLPEQPD
jgi:hypothetical protein